MKKERRFNRWFVVLGALLIQISLGAIYIYSVFKPALEQKFTNWSHTDLALPSQLVLAFFAFSTILSGRIQDKFGPRIMATVGSILLGAGLLIASFAKDLTTFIIGFSILGGIGIGSAYVCPIATCVKWFPDKRGLITGLAVFGFGAGGLVFTPVAKALIGSVGIMSTFLYLGIIFFITVLAGAQLMVNPTPGYRPKNWTPPAEEGSKAQVGVDYSWHKMLGTYQFWLLWLSYFAGCTAGLMIIMNTTNIWQSFSLLKISDGMVVVMKKEYIPIISACATAVMVVSILNALGRIIWGKVSDNVGRKLTLLIMFLYSGIIMLLMNWFDSYPLFIFGVSSVGFCFGGFLALYPAVTADYFGTKNVGVNYGLMFSAYGAGGLFGPWLAPKLMKIVSLIPYEYIGKSGQIGMSVYKAGTYLHSFIISGAMCIVSAILIFLIKKPIAE
ncbi:MAG: L-lactate MFS transporter [bacterium]